MIVTNNAIYLHVPKTGGTWMRSILQPIAIEEHRHELLMEPADVPVCAFVRNPWGWYVSSYNAITKGTTSDPFDKHDPVIVALGRVPTFEEFLECQLQPTPEFKRKLLAMFKLRKDGAFVRIAEQWMDTDLDWYSLLIIMFTINATEIGQYEFIRMDLMLMMDKVGDLNDETIELLDTPPLNVGELADYREYYTAQQAEDVYNACRSICNEFRYQY